MQKRLNAALASLYKNSLLQELTHSMRLALISYVDSILAGQKASQSFNNYLFFFFGGGWVVLGFEFSASH
jgi:hypothetical protein